MVHIILATLPRLNRAPRLPHFMPYRKTLPRLNGAFSKRYPLRCIFLIKFSKYSHGGVPFSRKFQKVHIIVYLSCEIFKRYLWRCTFVKFSKGTYKGVPLWNLQKVPVKVYLSLWNFKRYLLEIRNSQKVLIKV